VNAPTFWNVRDGTVAGNEITNTYAPQGKQFDGNLIKIEPGSGIRGGLVTVQFGEPAAPQLPHKLSSTPQERARLRDQLLALADTVESVMAPWGQSRHDIGAQIGVPPDEFLSRMDEILVERTRIDDEAGARYNAECRSAVVQAYGTLDPSGLRISKWSACGRRGSGRERRRFPRACGSSPTACRASSQPAGQGCDQGCSSFRYSPVHEYTHAVCPAARALSNLSEPNPLKLLIRGWGPKSRCATL
jgi:hypothetical protein